jgi:hypothetical protein
VNTQRWECHHGHILCERPLAQEKKQPKTKVQTEAQKKHLAFLRSVGYTGPNKKSCVEFQSLKVESKNVAPVSNSIPGNGFKRSIDDYKWKSGRSEREEVIAETERKKKRLLQSATRAAINILLMVPM